MARRAIVTVVVAGLLAACSAPPAAPLVAPPIPTTVVPVTLTSSGGLHVVANTTAEIGQAFASVGPTSLVKSGRVWEVRKGDRLVGALELASIGRRADTRKEPDRLAIRQQILPGEPTELDFSGVPVYEAHDGARSVFVWFGRQIFGALQIKGEVDADAVANELITVILQDNRWPALPAEAFDQS